MASKRELEAEVQHLTGRLTNEMLRRVRLEDAVRRYFASQEELRDLVGLPVFATTND